MMKKIMAKKPGNIMLTFLLVMVFALVLSSLFFVQGGRLRSVTGGSNYLKALYIAEAGLNKAMWNLATPASSGGKGVYWRASGTMESYAGGEYRMSVTDSGTHEITILSTGEIGGLSRTVSQVLLLESFPAAFDYALYSNSNLSMSGSVHISGDIYSNGDTRMTGSCRVDNGKVYYSDDGSVSGSGSCQYQDGGTPNPAPEMPTLDTSSYDSRISIAQSMSAGNVNYSGSSDIYLNGSTIYVNGNLTISGSGTIRGPGAFVVTGTTNISGSRGSDGSEVKFVSNGALSVSGSASMPNSSFYSKADLSVSGSGRFIVGSFITERDLRMSGSCTLQGMGYAGGAARFSGTVQIIGSLVSQSVSGLSGTVDVRYDRASLPGDAPAGFSGTKLSRARGSWKEKK
jgi:hypothetical protein